MESANVKKHKLTEGITQSKEWEERLVSVIDFCFY